jgi:hypothetical protein
MRSAYRIVKADIFNFNKISFIIGVALILKVVISSNKVS